MEPAGLDGALRWLCQGVPQADTTTPRTFTLFPVPSMDCTRGPLPSSQRPYAARAARHNIGSAGFMLAIIRGHRVRAAHCSSIAAPSHSKAEATAWAVGGGHWALGTYRSGSSSSTHSSRWWFHRILHPWGREGMCVGGRTSRGMGCCLACCQPGRVCPGLTVLTAALAIQTRLSQGATLPVRHKTALHGVGWWQVQGRGRRRRTRRRHGATVAAAIACGGRTTSTATFPLGYQNRPSALLQVQRAVTQGPLRLPAWQLPTAQ